MHRSSSTKPYTLFKEKHPKWHVANVCVSLFLPLCLDVLFVIFKEMDGRGIFSLYSMAGSFLLGIGLASWAAFLYDKKIFLKFAVYPIAVGALIALGNLICACSNVFGTEFDEKRLEFQMVCYLAVFIFSVCYFTSRDGITDYISSKTHLNENQLDRRKEGFFNALWYRRIHEEFGIGWLYYFNVFFTVILFLFFIGTCFLVFSKSAVNVTMALCLVAGLSEIFLGFFLLAMAIKRKRSYHQIGRKRLLGKIPYTFEIGNIILILVFVWLSIKEFISL